MTITVLSSDLVLAIVSPESILDFKDGVVVGVGDLDPFVLLCDEVLLLLGDEAFTMGPSLIGDGLTNDINRPAVGSSNLTESCVRFNLKIFILLSTDKFKVRSVIT